MILKLTLILIVLQLLAELWLSRLNRQEVQRHADKIPDAFRAVMDEATYAKAVAYTLAKNQFGFWEMIYDTLLFVVILLSGFLPWFYGHILNGLGPSVWANAFFLLSIGLVMSLPGLPFDWYSQFRLEERFGFNKTTLKLWLTDMAKGTALGFVIGFPLLCLLLKIVDWMGETWWLWGFSMLFAFEMIMMVLYPRLILPLFNKLTPLPEGELRDRLIGLADRTGFKAQTIQVIDGSKRSTHSNAFFTGFGRFRRIVLYDTLIEQLSQEQLEAVLAHEIGHYKKGHIPKGIALSVVTGLFSFWVLAQLADSAWFYEAFGFVKGASIAPAFLLFGLLSGLVTFWFTPLFNRLSRKHEYEADAFARAAVGSPQPLIESLRKMTEKNLSNLTPHPIFSGFYYSHPTLPERERALLA